MDKTFWKKRYQDGNTGWDTGSITTPLKEYFDQLEDKSINILIPGAGNAHEAAYLHQQGFNNVFVLDIAEEPLFALRAKLPDFPEDHLICEDFFVHEGQYDLIVEQTFFCALPPAMRPNYAQHMKSLLAPKGKLRGLMFDFPLTETGPPFGGCQEEYAQYFDPLFEHVEFARACNSIAPRDGNELWVAIH